MIPVEAEDIPLVEQIAKVPRRVLNRTERHADQRAAFRVAARGSGPSGTVRSAPCSELHEVRDTGLNQLASGATSTNSPRRSSRCTISEPVSAVYTT
jgi:hypothetical protein